MKIKIKYFAALREQAGITEEVLDTAAVTADELLSEVKVKHGLKLSTKHLKVAVNEEYMPFSTRLNENDTVVFIPPVAGG